MLKTALVCRCCPIFMKFCFECRLPWSGRRSFHHLHILRTGCALRQLNVLDYSLLHHRGHNVDDKSICACGDGTYDLNTLGQPP
eukprot:387980-Amphidinium_carterae.1